MPTVRGVCWIRGHPTEQHRRLRPYLVDIGQTVTTDRDRHREVVDDLARVVGGQRFTPLHQRCRQSGGQAGLLRRSEQHRGPACDTTPVPEPSTDNDGYADVDSPT